MAQCVSLETLSYLASVIKKMVVANGTFFSLSSIVKGDYVDQNVWTPGISEVATTASECDNLHQG